MRRELVGEAAAGRLATVDKEDANFDKRFQQYQQQKQSIVQKSANSSAANRQLAQLEQQLFSETERKRLTGYAVMKALENQQFFIG